MIVSLKNGLRYALIFLLVSAAMGLVYGLFGGILWQSALFSVTTVGLFAVINFAVACLVAVPLVPYRAWRGGAAWFVRYFGYSLAFVLVFFPVFVFIELLPVGPF